MRWGNLRRRRPFSELYGYDRGRPVDRVYIEDFLEGRSGLIRGHVLELADSTYTRRFGGARVTASDVLDLDSDRPGVTIAGDLCDPETLAGRSFDTIVLTQALHLMADPRAALRSLYQALRPGGVLLITVPALQRRALPHDAPRDLWRFTGEGLEELLHASLPGARVTVEARGTLMASLAVLLGLAEEDLRPRDLAPDDSDFPVIAAAEVIRPRA